MICAAHSIPTTHCTALHADPIDAESMTLEDAGKLLPRWQLNEWALDKKMTKKALKEQRSIIKTLLTKLCNRYVAEVEIDHILGSLN